MPVEVAIRIIEAGLLLAPTRIAIALNGDPIFAAMTQSATNAEEAEAQSRMCLVEIGTLLQSGSTPRRKESSEVLSKESDHDDKAAAEALALLSDKLLAVILATAPRATATDRA